MISFRILAANATFKETYQKQQLKKQGMEFSLVELGMQIIQTFEIQFLP